MDSTGNNTESLPEEFVLKRRSLFKKKEALLVEDTRSASWALKGGTLK